jgi:hypothetical protein
MEPVAELPAKVEWIILTVPVFKYIPPPIPIPGILG